MGFGRNQLILLKEVFTKVKKDEITGKYYLTPDTYLHLNLTKRVMGVFERMCNKYNVILYRFPERISEKETEELFIRYYSLKNQFNETIDGSLKEIILKEMIEIRNKIALGYMEVMYRLISDKFPNLLKEQDSEDIFQIGYETLLVSIDKYDMSKKTTFIVYLKTIAIYRLSEKIWATKRNTSDRIAREMIWVMGSRDMLEDGVLDLDVDAVKKKTGLSEDKIKYLLSKINLTNDTSLGTGCGEEVVEEDFLEELVEISSKDALYKNLSIIIDLLPVRHKEVIRLYFGFVDGQTHTCEEIANMLNFNNRERVRQIRDEALSILSIPIYLEAISSYSDDKTLPSERLAKLREMYVLRREDDLEDIIINSFSKDFIRGLIKEFPPIYKEILELYYGLNDDLKHSINDICVILDKKAVEVRDKKRKAVIKLALAINPDKPYYQTLIDEYLKIRKKGV